MLGTARNVRTNWSPGRRHMVCGELIKGTRTPRDLAVELLARVIHSLSIC